MYIRIRELLNRLLCKHNWQYYCYNIDTNERYEPITISFRDCPKCAKSGIIFIFGNKPRSSK